MPYYSFIRNWSPDLQPLNNPGLTEAAGVFPDPAGFEPIPLLQTADSVSAATITEVVGGFGTYLTTPQAGTAIFAASRDRIWYIDASGSPTWQNKSNASASYGSTVWSFTRYNTVIIATGIPNPPQRSSMTASPTAFVDLAGTPPAAAFVVVVRDFVVMARTAADPRLVQWSALGNPSDYVASATTQSDSQTISQEGDIVGIVGGEYGLIFFRNAIYRMIYIGSPAIFQFDKIAGGVGISADIPGNPFISCGYMAARHGENVFFFSDRGLAVVRSGQAVEMISAHRNENYIRIVAAGAVDAMGKDYPLRPKFIVPDEWRGLIALGTGTVTASGANAMFYYDPLLDRFSRASLDAQFIFAAPPLVINSGGGGPMGIAYISGVNRLQRMNQGIMACTVESGEMQPAAPRRAIVNWIRPDIQASSLSIAVQMGYRNRTNESVTYGAAVTVNATGVAPMIVNARNMRVNIQLGQNASWSVMHGFSWEPIDGGDR